jgi:hypothetical protein
MKAMALIALGLAACAGSVPVKVIAESEASYKAAQAVDAQSVPQANLHLQFAKEQLARAQTLIKVKAYVRAEGALLRAKSDADLAYTIALKEKANKDAQTSLLKLAKVREQGSNSNTQIE